MPMTHTGLPAPIHLEDKKLFLRFETFFHEFWMNYFCSRIIRMPWGIWAVGLPDDDSLVWRGNAHLSAQVMALEIEKLAQEYGLPFYGVYLSPSWDGDLTTFLQQLKNMGWINTFNVFWLVRESTEPSSLSAFVKDVHIHVLPLEQVQISQDLINLCNPTCGESMLKEPTSPTHVRRLIAIATDSASGKVAGIGLAAYSDDIGYMYSLRVSPEFRNRGIAKALVSARLEALKKKEVRYVVTAVVQDNAASLNIQLKQGYRVFASTHAWQPPGNHSSAYLIEDELKAK